MEKVEVEKLIKYSSEGPAKEVFYDKGNLKAQVVCLKGGKLYHPAKCPMMSCFISLKAKEKL